LSKLPSIVLTQFHSDINITKHTKIGGATYASNGTIKKPSVTKYVEEKSVARLLNPRW
jgi:hypothetical protein